MSHRLAELIDRYDKAKSDSARDKAAAAVEDLVLKLWTHRATQGRTWPPRTYRELTNVLEPRDDFGPTTGRSVWFERWRELDEIQRDEARVWLGAALIDIGVDEERRVVETVDTGLEFEERQKMQGIVALHDEVRLAMREQVDSYAEMRSRANRAERCVRPLLGEIAARRERLIGEVVAKIANGAKPSGE